MPRFIFTDITPPELPQLLPSEHGRIGIQNLAIEACFRYSNRVFLFRGTGVKLQANTMQSDPVFRTPQKMKWRDWSTSEKSIHSKPVCSESI